MRADRNMVAAGRSGAIDRVPWGRERLPVMLRACRPSPTPQLVAGTANTTRPGSGACAATGPPPASTRAAAAGTSRPLASARRMRTATRRQKLLPAGIEQDMSAPPYTAVVAVTDLANVPMRRPPAGSPAMTDLGQA